MSRPRELLFPGLPEMLAVGLALMMLPACDPASSLPIRLEEPVRAGETVQVDRIDVDEAYRIIDEVLVRHAFVRQEDWVDGRSGEVSRHYFGPGDSGWRYSCSIDPTESGLEIRLNEFGRWDSSSNACELAEALRVALGTRFGEDCVSW